MRKQPTRTVGTALVSGHREYKLPGGAGGGLALVREGRRAGHTADPVGDLHHHNMVCIYARTGTRTINPYRTLAIRRSAHIAKD